jgi:predicted Rossmann fold nucleotide-binding protein DprA/Smf involved in DNA uptake
VFAVPGDIGKPLSMGTNGLIRDGLAKCVTAPEDVFSELPGIFSESNRERTDPQLGHGVPPSEPVLRTLFQLGTANVDTVARVMGKSVSEIGAALSMFEIEGKAVSDDRGAYRAI